MRLPKSAFYLAAAAIAVTASFQARPSGETANALYDENAFDSAWTGNYYVEPAEHEETRANSDFAAKREYYLNAPDVDVEEEELDGNGDPVPTSSAEPDDAVEPGTEPSPFPIPRPYASPSPTPFFLPYPNFGDPNYPWGTIPNPSGVTVPPTPAPSPVAPVKPEPAKPQAFRYYNSGSLANATQLANDGKGFLKVFRDRDEATGGRGWGTRTLISLIESTAAAFADRFPGRERLQVADIARKTGGRMTHGSHQNGLDADIVFLRKNRKEQAPFGGYGKNGFAEQFVLRTSSTKKTKDSHGKPRTVRVWHTSVSANFDVAANFAVMRMFFESGSVKMFFIDKVLIRELFRYADARKLSGDPGVRAFLASLDHAPSHTDHFHVRLFCQATDTKCVSSTAPRVSHHSSKKKRGRK